MDLTLDLTPYPTPDLTPDPIPDPTLEPTRGVTQTEMRATRQLMDFAYCCRFRYGPRLAQADDSRDGPTEGATNEVGGL